MAKTARFAAAVGGFFLALSCAAQEPFVNCAAAFLNQKIIVDEYSPTGKCAISADATGTLTVCTADLSPEKCVAKDKIKFKIAIRDKGSNTLLLFSDKTYEQVDIQKVLARCKKGDHIVLLTLDDRYALPHHEILVKG